MVVRFRVRVLLDRKEVLVSSAAKTLPFWTRTEPVEPGSILWAPPSASLLLFSPLIPALPLAPSSCSSFPGPMGAVPRCWLNLLDWGKEGKGRKVLSTSTWANAFTPFLPSVLLFTNRKDAPSSFIFCHVYFFQACGQVESSLIFASEILNTFASEWKSFYDSCPCLCLCTMLTLSSHCSVSLEAINNLKYIIFLTGWASWSICI